MSLFDNLPAPGLEPKRLADDLEELQALGKDEEGSQHKDSPPPAKRSRLDELQQSQQEADARDAEDQYIPEQQHDLPEPGEATASTAAPPEASLGPDDQLGQALAKIASHISRSSKFAKASALLRQLLDTGTIDKDHRHQLFQAIKAAFADPSQATEPTLRKEYRRLMATVNEHAQVLSKAERAQLSVYSTWALTQNELFTDDSFMFNKVIAKLKSSISELLTADEELEAAARRLSGEETSSPDESGHPMPHREAKPADESDPFGLDTLLKEEQQQQPSKTTAAAAAAAAEKATTANESDPFGLDSFLQEEQQQQQQQEGNVPAGAPPAASCPPAAKAKSLAWSPAEQQVMVRQALLDCLTTAKGLHKLAWAQTSVELLIEHAFQQKVRFCSSQQQQLLELMNFVKAARVARRTGRGGGAMKGSDMTAFERARAEWGNAAVSVRGKVGSCGDAKSNNWLG
jgi:uncharacterized protein (DUF2267 family)